MKNTNRRGFLKGVATLPAMGAVKCGSAMMPLVEHRFKPRT